MKQAERPGLHRWTRDEYERLIDQGFLDEDDPVELLDGLLLVKEPQHSRHRTSVLLVARAVERAFGERSSSRSRSRACAWREAGKRRPMPAHGSRTTGSSI